jgi:hypothetical protein
MGKRLICSRGVEEMVKENWHIVNFPKPYGFGEPQQKFVEEHCAHDYYVEGIGSHLSSVWFNTLQDSLDIKTIVNNCQFNHFVTWPKHKQNPQHWKDYKEQVFDWLQTHMGPSICVSWPDGVWGEAYYSGKGMGIYFRNIDLATEYSLTWG